MTGDHIKATKPRNPPRGSGRLRSACDPCHHSKVRCSVVQAPCTYSEGGRLGRPKGSKNKRTLAMQEPKKTACSNAPGTSRISTDSGIPGFVQPSRRRRCASHQRDLSKASLSHLTTPNSGDPVHCDDSMLLEGLSDSSFSEEWSSWINSIDIDLDLDEALQPEFGLQFYQCVSATGELTFPDSRQSPNSVTCDAGDAWGISFGSTRSERTLPGPLGPTGTPKYPRTQSQDDLLHQKTSKPPSGPECGCLQQLVRLVYHLEDFRYSHMSDPSIDSVLHWVRDAQEPWKTLMQCCQCQSNYDQEVLLLFAMSIRTLLCSMYALYAGNLQDARNLQVTSSLSISSTPPPSAASTSSVPDRQIGSDERDLRVSVGSYQLTEEEKCLTLGLMIRNALRSIAVALEYLCEKTDKFIGGSFCQQDAHGSSCSSPGRTSKGALIELLERLRQSPLELGHLKVEDVGSLLHNLRTTMEALKNATNKSNQQYQSFS